MVETVSLELTTLYVQGRCSFQLSYVPIFIFMRVLNCTRISHHLYCVLRCFFQLRWVHRAGRSHQTIGPIQPRYESYRRRGILYSISKSDAITCFNKRRLFLLFRLFDHILHYLSWLKSWSVFFIGILHHKTFCFQLIKERLTCTYYTTKLNFFSTLFCFVFAFIASAMSSHVLLSKSGIEPVFLSWKGHVLSLDGSRIKSFTN